MNIGVYEVYRENGICTLREEKAYTTNVERYTVMKSSELYDLCANILKMVDTPLPLGMGSVKIHIITNKERTKPCT